MNPKTVLDRFVKIDIGFLFVSLVLGLPHPLSVSPIIWAVVIFSFNFFLLIKILQQKNWARRTYLLLVVSAWFIIPVVLFPAFPEFNRLINPVFPRFGYAFNWVNMIFTLLFAGVLLHPAIRALFTSTPPKRYQRLGLIGLFVINLGVGIVLVLLGFKTREYIQLNDGRVSLAPRGQEKVGPFLAKQKKGAETALGLKLSDGALYASPKVEAGTIGVSSWGGDYENLFMVVFIMAEESISIDDAWAAQMRGRKERRQINLHRGEKATLLVGGKEMNGERIKLHRTGRRNRDGLLFELPVNKKKLFIVLDAIEFDDNQAREYMERFLALNTL